jgi:hypothetical protein
MPFWIVLLIAISVLGALFVVWDVERIHKEAALPYWKTNEPFFDLKASHWVELFLTAALLGVGGGQLYVYWRQADIMTTQAEIARAQTEISLQSARAIVFAKDVRVEKKDGAIPGKPGQFEPYWWFSPIIENGGNTTTKNMRIRPQATIDPTRPEIEVKLPFGMALGPNQAGEISHLPEVGPNDPEQDLIESEAREREGKPSYIVRTILGPHVSQTIAGFGVPIEETKRHIQEGGRWFLLGAIHYEDRFANSSTRLSKYCFAIGFETTPSGEINPNISSCAHWNCADDECESDKAAYNAETKNWRMPTLLSIPPSKPPYPSAPSAAPPAQ